MIKLLFKSKDSGVAGKGYQNSGFEQFKFAVNDPCWSKGEEAIQSLDLKYQDLWTVPSDADTEKNENVFPLGKSNLFSSKLYFPVYLQNKIQPDERNRFYFLSIFFFRKLADLDKDPSSASDGRVAFQHVRRWTRKVNLFEKDYIFLPVNYSLHWSLIVICHPGEMACYKGEEIENSPKVPCILHMDSMKGSHRGLKNVIQSYLCEEWKERHRKTGDEDSSKILDL
ncbi:Ubiquitin-like-specific protease 2 [Quillaja saponaria]|uniref:Ubiquitin-like-specific protease 2 n=1 Tax=Quillaja saponaria TaxID=32244 RepID=A0AAD7P8X8_QUISA|nr:Ubiquitin-like-specific protease 2 [Quillaja saponaria]